VTGGRDRLVAYPGDGEESGEIVEVANTAASTGRTRRF
jgi:hypothetical protein